MTTSVEMTRIEIKRFLRGDEPAVLCVTGGWGVGKTFLWRSVLDELRSSGGLSLTRYSYVSLFGLNSLEDIKSSLFENMEWLDQEPTNYSQKGKAGARALAARSKKLSELAGALPWVGQAFSKARSLYFSMIQNQIVCIDDLDRHSKSLDLKDVLGLISFLREYRGCKVILLLNSEKLGDKKQDFDDLLEKVIEAKVVLSPAAKESADIALPLNDYISALLRKNCETLGISNIRVIKQVERLVLRVDEILVDFPQCIRDQSVHSLTLFGWAKYDREQSPTLEFVKTNSIERHLAKNDRNEKPTEQEASWECLLGKYKFARADNFDLVLLKYVESMIFDVDEIRKQALLLQEQKRLELLHGTVDAAWRVFHESFDDDENRVVQEIIEVTKNGYEITSFSNLKSTVSLLKELGRSAEAANLLEYYSRYHDDLAYWNSQNDPFDSRVSDPDILAIIEQKRIAHTKEFDVAEGLILAGKNFDSDLISKLAVVKMEVYYDIISEARGDRKDTLIQSALEFRRISNASEDMKKVVELMEGALRMIGQKSKLNALRIRKLWSHDLMLSNVIAHR